MNKITKYAWIFLFIVILEIITGSPLTRFISEKLIILNINNYVLKITGLNISEEVEILSISTLVSLTGAGGENVYLELTPQETESLLKQIAQQSEWQLIQEDRDTNVCQIPSEYQTNLSGKSYYERIINFGEGVEYIGIFCPKINRLKIQTKSG